MVRPQLNALSLKAVKKALLMALLGIPKTFLDLHQNLTLVTVGLRLQYLRFPAQKPGTDYFLLIIAYGHLL